MMVVRWEMGLRLLLLHGLGMWQPQCRYLLGSEHGAGSDDRLATSTVLFADMWEQDVYPEGARVLPSQLASLGISLPAPLQYMSEGVAKSAELESSSDHSSEEGCGLEEHEGEYESRLWWGGGYYGDILMLRIWSEPREKEGGKFPSPELRRGELMLALNRGECPIGRWSESVCRCIEHRAGHDVCIVNLEELEVTRVWASLAPCRGRILRGGALRYWDELDLVFEQANWQKYEVVHYNMWEKDVRERECRDSLRGLVEEFRDLYVPAAWGRRFGRPWDAWWDASAGPRCEAPQQRLQYASWEPKVCCFDDQ